MKRRPDYNYVDKGYENVADKTDQFIMALSYYIARHRHDPSSGKYMPRATYLLKLISNGGTVDISHEDFRCIIACMLFYAKHFTATLAKFLQRANLSPTINDTDSEQMRKLAMSLLYGDFYQTVLKANKPRFRKLKAEHAPVEELLKL